MRFKKKYSGAKHQIELLTDQISVLKETAQRKTKQKSKCVQNCDTEPKETHSKIDAASQTEEIQSMKMNELSVEVANVSMFDQQVCVESNEPMNAAFLMEHGYSTKEPHKVPIICSYCQKKYKSEYNLRIHQNENCKHAPNSIKAKKDFKCEGCGERFTRNGLRFHLNKIVAGKRGIPRSHGNMTLNDHANLLNKIEKK